MCSKLFKVAFDRKLSFYFFSSIRAYAPCKSMFINVYACFLIHVKFNHCLLTNMPYVFY